MIGISKLTRQRMKNCDQPIDIYERMLDAAKKGKGIRLSQTDCITLLLADGAIETALEFNRGRDIGRELKEALG